MLAGGVIEATYSSPSRQAGARLCLAVPSIYTAGRRGGRTARSPRHLSGLWTICGPGSVIGDDNAVI